MKTSSVEFNSRSPTPSPMKSKHRRFAMLPGIFQPWQWKGRKKRDRFEQTSRTLARKISMRSSKEELVKKDVFKPDRSDKNQDSKINAFLLNLPDVKESLSVLSFLYVSDSPLVSMERKIGIRTAADSGQRTIRMAGCGIQDPIVLEKTTHSSRAGAAK
ncbi:phosphatase and actin regulator 2 [Trichonephila clavipes]|nr:phosphatase and actin regulator 2 [Trichonephila clavipes]